MMNYVKCSFVLPFIISCIGLNGAQEAAVAGAAFVAKRVVSAPLDELGKGLGQMVKDAFARRRFGDQYVTIRDDVQRVQDEERARLEIELESRIPDSRQVMIRMLHEAVRATNRARIIALLDQGVAVDCVIARRVTPLMIVSALGHTGIMSLLISRQANVNAQDADHETPLFYAVRNNRIGSVKILLDCFAHITLARDGTLPSQNTQSRMIQKMLEFPEARFNASMQRHERDDAEDLARDQRRAHARPRVESQESEEEDAPLARARHPRHADDDDRSAKKQRI